MPADQGSKSPRWADSPRSDTRSRHPSCRSCSTCTYRWCRRGTPHCLEGPDKPSGSAASLANDRTDTKPELDTCRRVHHRPNCTSTPLAGTARRRQALARDKERQPDRRGRRLRHARLRLDFRRSLRSQPWLPSKEICRNRQRWPTESTSRAARAPAVSSSEESDHSPSLVRRYAPGPLKVGGAPAAPPASSRTMIVAVETAPLPHGNFPLARLLFR
jgi:hypothetical protein